MSRTLGIELLRRVLRRLLVQRRELEQRAQPGEPEQARNPEQAQLRNARQLRDAGDVQDQRRQQQIRHARGLSTETSQRHFIFQGTDPYLQLALLYTSHRLLQVSDLARLRQGRVHVLRI